MGAPSGFPTFILTAVTGSDSISESVTLTAFPTNIHGGRGDTLSPAPTNIHGGKGDTLSPAPTDMPTMMSKKGKKGKGYSKKGYSKKGKKGYSKKGYSKKGYSKKYSKKEGSKGDTFPPTSTASFFMSKSAKKASKGAAKGYMGEGVLMSGLLNTTSFNATLGFLN